MKKYILFFSAFLTAILSFINLPTARADSEKFYRVITQDTPFFSDENMENLLFYLPYTYYVKVLDETDKYVHVECCGNGKPSSVKPIDGYVPIDLLYDDGQPVESPYPEISITTACTSSLYKDSDLSDTLQYVFPERSLNYYGYLVDGENYVYFVDYNGKLGYIKEESVYPFTLSDHPNKLTFVPTVNEEVSPSDEQEETEEKENQTLRILIIIAIVLAGVIALFTVKLPKKENDTTLYYDENDYK